MDSWLCQPRARALRVRATPASLAHLQWGPWRGLWPYHPCGLVRNVVSAPQTGGRDHGAGTCVSSERGGSLLRTLPPHRVWGTRWPPPPPARPRTCVGQTFSYQGVSSGAHVAHVAQVSWSGGSHHASRHGTHRRWGAKTERPSRLRGAAGQEAPGALQQGRLDRT